MLIRLPHPPLMFEIPDAWLIEAGVGVFTPATRCFRYTATTSADVCVEALLMEIAPMLRIPGVHPAAHGFRPRGRNGEQDGGMIGVLVAIVTGVPLPPVSVCMLRQKSAEGFVYKVRDGFHRYYASIALGFTHLPCAIGYDTRPEPLYGEL